MNILVGERINTSRKPILAALARGDREAIAEEARRQAAAGATHIDVNAGGTGRDEIRDLLWLMNAVQEAVDLPLCLDSADPRAVAAGLEKAKKPPIVNSISLETGRFSGMLPVLEGKNVKVAALCVSDRGLPATAADAVDRAGQLIHALEGAGIARPDILVDPVVQPVATDAAAGERFLESIREISRAFPGVGFLCGLSNISFGLPEREKVNRCFLSLCLGAGLSGAILDPLPPETAFLLSASRMLLGGDPYCLDFIKTARGLSA